MDAKKLKQKGYMIIEVLLAAAIMTTAIITPMSNIDESRRQINKNRVYANAIFIANKTLEEIKMKDYLTFDEGVNLIIDSDLVAGQHTKVVNKDNVSYTVTWTVTDLNKYKEISLEVTWNLYGISYKYPNKPLKTIRTLNYIQ